MSDRSASPSEEGDGDEIRPHGDNRDSSEESSEEDPEEYRRVAEGFIVQDAPGEENGDEDEEAENEEEKARRRKERKKRRKRERAHRETVEELSDDDLELLHENRGFGGPSKSRPLKRLRRRSGSGATDEVLPTLQDIFREDEERARLEEDEDDDLGDFIEEDEEEDKAKGESEEQRRERKREEKLRRREAARARPDLAGVDKG